MAAEILSTGTVTLSCELFILEAGGVTCLNWVLPETDTEIRMRVPVVHRDADTREHG